MIKKYIEYIKENVTPKSDVAELNKNGLDVKHKTLIDINNPDMKYDVYWGRNAKTNDFLTTNFSGKFARPIGGNLPSENDIWMHITSQLNSNNFYKTKSGDIFEGDKPERRVVGTHLIIKTLKDDKVPENIILQAADIVRKNSHLEIITEEEKKRIVATDLENCDIVFCKKNYVSKKTGSVLGQVQVEHSNARYIQYTKGNINIKN
jgi:hypothetical protein